MGKVNKDFYTTQTESSRIKANIVAKYFPQYCKIILKRQQEYIAYVDLFAGPGYYDDGKPSTPILIGDEVANDSLLREKVVMRFNDLYFSAKLEANYARRFAPDTFKHTPRFANKEVGNDTDIDKYLARPPKKTNPTPTLLFVDPWGYKGVDTLLLANFLKHWGNELFLFVNIKRIQAAIQNDKFSTLMKQLFPTRFEQIRQDYRYAGVVHERLSLIMDNLADEFQTHVGNSLYSCSFKFKEEDSVATSHFIIHFTKHAKGYELVKQVYYDFDNIGATLERKGVYTFDIKKMGRETDLLTEANVWSLADQLAKEFQGRQLTAEDLFANHQKDTNYCASHYVKALRHLYENQILNATFTDEIQHKVSVLISPACHLSFL